MSKYVTDTHALLWHISNSANLSARAKVIFDNADMGRAIIIVPSIVLVECVYLAEKRRIEEERINEVFFRLSRPRYSYKLVQIEVDTILALRSIARTIVPDMPDRIIAATALQLGLPLITKDGRISSLPGLTVIW
jgi:PIN domain nuclease of toxin-antitoxin system